MCRSCGAIIGGGESKCAVCNAPIASKSQVTRPRPVADRETIRFARAILDRPYKFTLLFLMLNFFIFLLMWESSGMTWQALWEFRYEVLIAYGAKINRLINEQHQWWRFVTPIFVHVNLPHVLINMYSLWMVGPYVEKLYGSAKFVVFWVLTGIAGVTASYLSVLNTDQPLGLFARFLFKTTDVPSAGASGALFGLVGVLFVFGIKFRHELPEGFKRAFGTGMLPIILINLFIGFLGSGVVDNAAHLGGLVSGAVLATMVQYRRPGERATVTASWYALEVAALLLVTVSFFKVAQHFHDPVTVVLPGVPSVSSENSNALMAYLLAVNNAQEALNYALDGDLSGVDQAVSSLDSVPHVDEKADELKERLKDILIKTKSATGPGPAPAGRQKPVMKTSTLVQEAAVWKKEYEQWLKTAARNE
jgi:rhomboid protease GluP